MAVMKRGLECSFEHIHELINKPENIRQYLGNSEIFQRHYFTYQLVVDYVNQVRPEVLAAVSQMVIESDHAVSKKKPWRILSKSMWFICGWDWCSLSNEGQFVVGCDAVSCLRYWPFGQGNWHQGFVALVYCSHEGQSCSSRTGGGFSSPESLSSDGAKRPLAKQSRILLQKRLKSFTSSIDHTHRYDWLGASSYTER